jgi:hypothetical protein
MKWLMLLFILLCFACGDDTETKDAGTDATNDVVTETAPTDAEQVEAAVDGAQQPDGSVVDAAADKGADQ